MPTRTGRIASSSAAAFGTGPYTSASFTPNNSSLLVAIGFAIETTDTGLEGTSLTITDSAGLTWTSRAATTTSPAWSYGIRIWTAPVTTGASMTVSIDAGAFSVEQYRLVVVDYTNYDTATPVGGTIVGSDADGDGAATVTLSASPLSASEVIAAAMTGVLAGTGSITVGTGWTETDEAALLDWVVYQTQIRTGSTSTTVTWDDVLASGTGFGGSTLAAVEIRHASAAATQEQEGFRFGIDDGNEAAHTWAQAQDANDTVAAGTPRLLRVVLDAAGDPAAASYKLQFRKVGNLLWRDVKP